MLYKTEEDAYNEKTQKFDFFLLISFLIPLVAVVSQTIIPNDSVCFVLYGIQAASPTISAVVVLCLNKEVKTHFTQIFRKGCIISPNRPFPLS